MVLKRKIGRDRDASFLCVGFLDIVATDDGYYDENTVGIDRDFRPEVIQGECGCFQIRWIRRPAITISRPLTANAISGQGMDGRLEAPWGCFDRSDDDLR